MNVMVTKKDSDENTRTDLVPIYPVLKNKGTGSQPIRADDNVFEPIAAIVK